MPEWRLRFDYARHGPEKVFRIAESGAEGRVYFCPPHPERYAYYDPRVPSGSDKRP